MSSPMLDPDWTPAAGYAHAAALLAACERATLPTIPHEGRESSPMTPTKKSKLAGPISTKISPKAYRIATAIAKRNHRTLTATLDLAVDALAAKEGGSK
jgi:hypothetical protein